MECSRGFGLSLPYALLATAGCMLFAAIVAAAIVGLITYIHRDEWTWDPWWKSHE